MKQKNKAMSRPVWCIVLALCTFFLSNADQNMKNTDMVIFSYDRPLQLHTLLNSVQTYVSNIHQVFVIYRASNQSYAHAYTILSKMFPHVSYIKQGDSPQKDFKPSLLSCIASKASSYVLFATDDDIFTEPIDISSCQKLLESSGAYGFYLRLGKNITRSYFTNKIIALPVLHPYTDDTFTFSLNESSSYWAYPNNVNMTIYLKASIITALVELSYFSPNILESRWARLYPIKGDGLCFTHSKGINIPLNLVQDNWHNKHEIIFSTQQLLDLWNSGHTMDLTQFHYINNNAAHMPYLPKFIKRDT